jgi:hypothetical protein
VWPHDGLGIIASYAILIQLVFAVLIFIGIILFIMVLNKNDND